MYTKTIWANSDPSTPLNDVNLNKIETGIEDAHITADQNNIDIAAYNDWTVISADPGSAILASNVENIMIAFAGASTVTLPGIPTAKSKVRIIDAGADFSVNNLTINNNGNKIMGALSNYIYSTANSGVELVWSGASYGWVVLKNS